MKRSLVLIISMIGFGSVWAQEPLNLSFKEAVRIALDNNIRLKQERNNLTTIQAVKTASYASLAPDLSASAIAFRSDGNFFIEQTGEVVNTISDKFRGSLDADVMIFNGLSKINAVKRDIHRFDSQVSTIFRTEQDIIGDVSIQYLQILQDQEQVTIARGNLENQQVLLNQITVMFEVGSRAITDKYDQDYQEKNAELEVIRAENRLINDKAILAQTLMVDPFINFILEEPGWNVNDINLDDYNINDIQEIALSNRGDMISAQEDERAAKRNIQVQKGRYIPSLVGFYSLSSRYSDVTARDFQDQFIIDNKNQQYGFSLRVPIFSGYRNRANVTSAKVLHENALLEIDNREIQVKTDVLRAYQNFKDVALAYQTRLIQFQAAEKSMETQRESYNVGISSLIEVSRANNVFVDAQTSLSRSKYALLFQKILMDYAIGTLNFDQISK